MARQAGKLTSPARLYEPQHKLYRWFCSPERGLLSCTTDVELAIVRALTEAHGGSVSAASAGVGVGATFTVRLPLETGPARLGQDPAARPIRAGDLTGLRVLIVDDAPTRASSWR